MYSGDVNLNYPGTESGSRRMEAAIIVAITLFLLSVLFGGQGWLILLLVMAGAVPLLAYRWPYGALVLLVLGSAAPRYTAKFASLTTKPEHLATIAVFVTIVLVYRHQKTKWILADIVLIGFVLISFVSSVIGSPDRRATLLHSGLFGLVALPYWLMPRLVTTSRRLQFTFGVFLGIGAAEAIFGIGCWIANRLIGTQLGITRFTYLDNISGLHGSQWEPNIFGSYIASCAAMFLFVLLNKGRVKWSRVGLSVTVIAVLLSMARAAWLGLACASLFAFIASRRNNSEAKRVWRGILCAIAAASVIVLLVMIIAPLRHRVISLAPASVLEDTTLIHRVVFTADAIEDIQAKPWLGYGTESFELLWNWDTNEGETGAWVGNVFIRILHDTGIIGLSAFCMFLWLLLRPAYLNWKLNRYNQIGKIVGALLASQIVLLIAYQFTEATLLTFTWLYFGLISAAVRLVPPHLERMPELSGAPWTSWHPKPRLVDGGELLESGN